MVWSLLWMFGGREDWSLGDPIFDRPRWLFLRDWVDSSNCCEWDGIECDNTTRRVIQLSLFDARDYSLGDWVLNASLFLPFKELRSLDLGYNGLVGCLENEGFEVLSSKLRELDLRENLFNNDKSILSCFNGFEIISSHLGKLENLDLSYNIFNDNILSHLRGLSSLKSLNLSGNMLLGSTTINGLRKLDILQSLRSWPSLKTLSLKDTNLSQELHLDNTSLPINFLQNIGALPALKVLSVGECDFYGTLPAQGWCELKNLKQLDLSRNNLGGSLPDCLGNLSSLQLFDVSQNQFTGNIPPVLLPTSYPLNSSHYQITCLKFPLQ
ncbi:hypothetical protein BDE02_16G036800 [Populus trichocarpa]|nr:hypothetical protein BDE02_16G036800 [Populus trichocarpa]